MAYPPLNQMASPAPPPGMPYPPANQIGLGGAGLTAPSGYGNALNPRDAITATLMQNWNRGQGGAVPTTPLDPLMPQPGMPQPGMPQQQQAAPGGGGAQLPLGMQPQNLVAQNLGQQPPVGQPMRPTPPGGGVY